VIAPYASALALMVAPEEACLNLQRLAAEGLEGKYGLYEAIDYTPSRLPRGQSSAVVRSFMAHHQGMSLLALGLSAPGPPDAEALRVGPVVPGDHAVAPGANSQGDRVLCAHRRALRAPSAAGDSGDADTRFHKPRHAVPEVQLLSNGRYHVMVTNAGGGYSRWKDLAVTRWREDSTCDNWGTFCYLRDVTQRGVLVHRISADAQADRSTMRRFSRKGGRVSRPRPRL
jgi:cyclic beta-1,2-glucan synthetase